MDKIKPVTNEEWLQINEETRYMVEEYLNELVNLSPKTVRQYTSGLKIYFRFIQQECRNVRFDQIKPRDYLKYQNYLVRIGMSSSGVSFKRSAVSAFNDWVITYYCDEYPTFHNYITKAIKRPPREFVNEKKPLTIDELDKLEQYLLEKEDWQKLAYLFFTYSTGCRRGESRQLLKEVVDYQPVVKTKTVKDEDGNSKEVTVSYYITHEIRCKGAGHIGKRRRLKFDEKAMKYIKKWIETRDDDNEFVFVTKYGGVINQVSLETFGQWCHSVFEPVIGRRIHPHILRESRATNLVVAEGKSLETAQQLLGHNSSETTKIYVIKDDDDEVDDAFI